MVNVSQPTSSDLEHLSALVDGEMSESALDEWIDRLLADVQWQSQWARYHQQADALRFPGAERLDGDAFQARVRDAVAREPVALSTVRRHRRDFSRVHVHLAAWKRYVMPGAAMAAAVAAVTWVSLSQFGREEARAPVLADSASVPHVVPTVAVGHGAAERDAESAAADPALQEYLLAHQQFAPSSQWHGVAPFVRVTSVGQSSRSKTP